MRSCRFLMFRDLLFKVFLSLELITAVFAYPCVCGRSVYGGLGFAASAVSAEHTERTEGEVAKASFAARIALGLDRRRILSLGQVLQIFASAFGTANFLGRFDTPTGGVGVSSMRVTPQLGQNFASSGKLLPQFLQNMFTSARNRF